MRTSPCLRLPATGDVERRVAELAGCDAASVIRSSPVGDVGLGPLEVLQLVAGLAADLDTELPAITDDPTVDELIEALLRVQLHESFLRD